MDRSCKLCDLDFDTLDRYGHCDVCAEHPVMTLTAAIGFIERMLADARTCLERADGFELGPDGRWDRGHQLGLAAGYHSAARMLAYRIGEARRVPVVLDDLRAVKAAA